jgi:hypothetical protein
MSVETNRKAGQDRQIDIHVVVPLDIPEAMRGASHHLDRSPRRGHRRRPRHSSPLRICLLHASGARVRRKRNHAPRAAREDVGERGWSC